MTGVQTCALPIFLLTIALSLEGWSNFARHYFRNLGWCLFLKLLRCFSLPGSPLPSMYSKANTLFGWVSPFGNLRIKAHLPAPRSLSQAITSFFAYHRQGIHHMLLFTWPYNFDVNQSSSSFIRHSSDTFFAKPNLNWARCNQMIADALAAKIGRASCRERV